MQSSGQHTHTHKSIHTQTLFQRFLIICDKDETLLLPLWLEGVRLHHTLLGGIRATLLPLREEAKTLPLALRPAGAEDAGVSAEVTAGRNTTVRWRAQGASTTEATVFHPSTSFLNSSSSSTSSLSHFTLQRFYRQHLLETETDKKRRGARYKRGNKNICVRSLSSHFIFSINPLREGSQAGAF